MESGPPRHREDLVVARRIATDVHHAIHGSCSVPCRRLLEDFGIRRRTPARIAEVAAVLEQVRLIVEPQLTMDTPIGARLRVRSSRDRPYEGDASGQTAKLSEPERRRPVKAIGAAPSGPGVYAWWIRNESARWSLGLTSDAARRPLYVGTSGDLPQRLDSYIRPQGRRTGLRGWLGLWLSELDDAMPRWYVPTPPLHDYAESVLTLWMHDHLEVSWIRLPSGPAAVAVERVAIGELRPLVNQRLIERDVGSAKWLVETYEQADGRLARAEWRLYAFEWAIERRRLIEALGPNDQRRFLLTQDGRIGRATVGRTTHPTVEIRGAFFHPLAEAFDAARPSAWYSDSGRPGELHAPPPAWQDVRTSLPEPVQRAVILRHRLGDIALMDRVDPPAG